MHRLEIVLVGINYAPESTGIAPYTVGLARSLAAEGHSVHVITGYPHYPSWRVADGYRGLRVHEWDGPVRITRVRHLVPRHPTGPGRILMEASFALAALTARLRRPDVVIAISPALLSVAAALRWRVGLRRRRTVVGAVVQDIYSSVVAEAGVLHGRGGGLVAWLEGALLSRVDGIAAIHDVFRSPLARAGVSPDRVSVVRNWTHVKAPTGSPAELREALAWPSDHTIALHAGNMGAKQGLENVVEAARHAQARQLPVSFVLLGDGNQRAHLVELGAECANLKFVDSLPYGAFETALAAADVLVLNERPSISEMCVPSKLTSYFAAGRPVVAATSNMSPAARELRAAGAGVVVEPGRPEQLLDVVTALGIAAIEDPATVKELGERGRAYAESHCSSEAANRAYLEWLRTLVARRDITRWDLAGIGPSPAHRPGRGRLLRRRQQSI